MIIKYCDKCGCKIKDDHDRNEVHLSNYSRDYSNGYAEIVLCDNCFKQLGIREKIAKVSTGEKKPEAVDQFINLLRELVAECVEELR